MKKFKILVILLSATILFVLYLSFRDIEDHPIKAENVLILDDQGQEFLKQLKIAKRKRPLDNFSPRVLLLSQFRTGSTFVGEIFNKNPDIFYLWEPLVCVPHNETLARNSFSKYIRDLCNCEFSKASASCLGNQREIIHSTGVAALCRRVTGVYGVECPLATPHIFHNQCVKSSGNIAMKVTQIGLDQIKNVVEESNINVKIIHLVRDPRGTANSRHFFMMTPEEKRNFKNSIEKQQNGTGVKSLKEMGYFDDLLLIPEELRIDQLCEWTHLNLQGALRQPKWLHNRYMLLRVEDFIQDPVKTAQDIYSFIGIPVSSPVLEWLEKLLIVTSSEEVSQLSNEASMFFPRKNFADIATKWRKYTKFSDVLETQRVCGDVMKMLGYDFITSEEELRNVEIKVIRELPFDIKMKLGKK
ncbi:carbohydrate sulfotransferase 1-like [Amphiura filiformis]|uniref:carbohydrate sulfotransferase 1-like n=1 Tax=Amphiura filiformis TaxID=82378 RepID=UPI003B228392